MRRSHSISAAALLVLLASPLHAQVPKHQWIEGMTSALPTVFCASDSYFRSCFEITAQQCTETALAATRACLAKDRSALPDVLVQPRDGTSWGTKIGTCAGGAVEDVLSLKKRDTAECRDISRWMK